MWKELAELVHSTLLVRPLVVGRFKRRLLEVSSRCGNGCADYDGLVHRATDFDESRGSGSGSCNQCLAFARKGVTYSYN